MTGYSCNYSTSHSHETRTRLVALGRETVGAQLKAQGTYPPGAQVHTAYKIAYSRASVLVTGLEPIH